MKIFDYTHRLKGNYFINAKNKVVLIDMEYRTIKPSSFSLKLFFRFSSGQLKEIPPDSSQYQNILAKYAQLLDNLIFID